MRGRITEQGPLSITSLIIQNPVEPHKKPFSANNLKNKSINLIISTILEHRDDSNLTRPLEDFLLIAPEEAKKYISPAVVGQIAESLQNSLDHNIYQLRTDLRSLYLMAPEKIAQSIIPDNMFETLYNASEDKSKGINDRLDAKTTLAMLFPERMHEMNISESLWEELVAGYGNTLFLMFDEIETIQILFPGRIQETPFYEAWVKREQKNLSIAEAEEKGFHISAYAAMLALLTCDGIALSRSGMELIYHNPLIRKGHESIPSLKKY